MQASFLSLLRRCITVTCGFQSYHLPLRWELRYGCPSCTACDWWARIHIEESPDGECKLLPSAFDGLNPPTPLPESPAPFSLLPYGSLAQWSSQCRPPKNTNSVWLDMQTTDHRWLAHQYTGLPISEFREGGRVGLHNPMPRDYRQDGSARGFQGDPPEG